MSESLEALIRDFAGRGEITHLSLTPRMLERGPKKVAGWAVTFAPASVMGNTYAEDTDPVAALTTALTDAKVRRRATFNDGVGAPKAAKASVPAVPVSEVGLEDLLG